MKLEDVGWIVVVTPKEMFESMPLGNWMEPLSYGTVKDPYPDELLRDRGATLFESKEVARAEMNKVIESGTEFAKNHYFGLLSVNKKT